MPDLDLNQHTSKKESTIVSGIAPTIEPPLARQLTLIRNGRLKIFMVDSFKMLTRNTEKLFMVINFVIANGATFLTQNYYLAPTSAARRRIPIRPAHTETEMWQHFQDTHGLTPVHADALKRTLQQATLVT